MPLRASLKVGAKNELVKLSLWVNFAGNVLAGDEENLSFLFLNLSNLAIYIVYILIFLFSYMFG